MQVRLKILQGSKSGKEIKLPAPQCLVGRSEECHLRPQVDAVSQRHCLIMTTESEVVVCDLKSRNGTYVNGEKVSEETVLLCGDHLRIGPLAFEVVIETAKAKRPKVRHTSDGSANQSTAVGGCPKGTDVASDFDSEPWSEDTHTAGDNELPLLKSGQTVVICDGILRGASGTIVKRIPGGQYLVSLGEQDGRVWARLPAHLLRAT